MKNRKKLNQRLNQVSKMLKENPNLKKADVAKAMKISLNYAYLILKQVRDATDTLNPTTQHAITVKDLLRSAQARIKMLEEQNNALADTARQLKEGYENSERELFETQAKCFDLKAIIKYLEGRNGN